VPPDAQGQLRARVRTELQKCGFADAALDTEMVRLERTILWLVEWEKRRREAGWTPLVEQWVRAEWRTDAGPVQLKAKVDRIDLGPDGEIEVLDFKTGQPPSKPQVTALIAPQLPVTAAIIASQPQQPPIPQTIASDFSYLRAGGRTPGQIGAVDPKKTDPEALATQARATVERLFVRYADGDFPYLSKPRVQFLGSPVRYAEPYDWLARRAEWANAQGGGDD
jgi:ATP-dependent helicase/nuclease subunit B